MSRRVCLALRPFEPADLEVLAAWLEAEGLGVPVATSHKLWGDRLLSDPLIVCHIAMVDADVAGFFRLDIGPDRSAEVSVMVAPSQRRRGIGRQLLDAGLTEAAHRGVRTLIAAVRDDNHAALTLFREAEFAESSQRVPGLVLLHRAGVTSERPPLETSA